MAHLLVAREEDASANDHTILALPFPLYASFAPFGMHLLLYFRT
jgi:hypothetical protein